MESYKIYYKRHKKIIKVKTSVADLDPHPDQDPYVFGPTGSTSGSISQRYGSGSRSGSFYHQAKIVSTVCDFFMTYYLRKNDLNVSSKSNKQQIFICWCLEGH
jgi:hypothetical protein